MFPFIFVVQTAFRYQSRGTSVRDDSHSRFETLKIGDIGMFADVVAESRRRLVLPWAGIIIRFRCEVRDPFSAAKLGFSRSTTYSAWLFRKRNENISLLRIVVSGTWLFIIWYQRTCSLQLFRCRSFFFDKSSTYPLKTTKCVGAIWIPLLDVFVGPGTWCFYNVKNWTYLKVTFTYDVWMCEGAWSI